MLSSQHTGSGLLLFGLTLSSPGVLAAQNWTCPDSPPNDAGLQQTKQLQLPELGQEAVYLEADQALFKEQGNSVLEGTVIIAKDDTRLTADLASYEKQTQQVTAQGNVYFISDGLELRSEKISFNLAAGTGEIEQADYQFSNADGRGSSKKLSREANGVARLTDASYTTCPVGNNSWSMHAKDIELDQEKQLGIARNLSLKIKDTPVAYLPYFSFPLNENRKSGFLTPTFATNEKSGVNISVPYYWNLAPNYDLTLNTSYLSQRGIKLDTGFRYLSEKQEGQFQYDFLPDDRDYNHSRYFFNLDYERKLDEDSQLTLNAQGVSDNQYFEDLGTSLESSSIVNLERTLRYTTQRGDWSFTALAQDFQVLDDSSEAHARLPQLNLHWEPDNDGQGIQWAVNGEYTFFTNSNANDGQRIDLLASAGKRFASEFAYIEPAVKLRHTTYQQDQGDKTTIHRTLPTVSVDGGLFFERELKDGKLIQTLEPRVYYTYTPFRDQTSIQVFDSSGKTLSYSQLFSDNRFTGKDRIEDANRLSTSLTTRLQNQQTGREVFRASIGQIYHFDDRRVALPDETVQTGRRSELVFEAAGELNASTRLLSTAFVDTREKTVSASQVKINYKDQKERVLNLGYNQRKGDYEAAHVSFATPVTRQWKVAAGYEHDLKNDRMLESVVGLEYRDCCWKARIAGREYLLSDNTNYDNAIFIELELKGLGNFGSSASDFLGNRIYGYE
ncbi:MAG: LPS-assembly protein LptD [Thiolinea sp.]